MHSALLRVGLALTAAAVLGCGGDHRARAAWEYKVVSVPSADGERTGTGALRPASIDLVENQLNDLGHEGWELVATFLEMETAFPNFGRDDYVTGLQPNVRPQRAVLIFKRPAAPQKAGSTEPKRTEAAEPLKE